MELFGNIIDLEKETIFYGSVKIDRKNRIISKISIIDNERKDENYILPGFIDSHIHIESSMLIPSEFSKVALKHGTVAVVADPHEIANVAGVDGVKAFYNNSLKGKMKTFWAAPSCVPASAFEESNYEITIENQKELFELENFVALGEVMNFPAVISKEKNLISKIENAKQNNKIIDGHTPGLSGDGLEKYFSAGISTDHECSELEEAVDRIKLGVKIQIREGSAAKNFDKLYPLIENYNNNCFFCSDDLHPDHLFEGHINLLVKRAVKKGIDPIKCLKVASYNPVKHYKLPVGLLQEGDSADFIIVDNLFDFTIKNVFIRAEDVLKEKVKSSSEKIKIDEYFYQNNLSIKDIEVKISSLKEIDKENLKIKVIGAEDKSLLTKNLSFSPKISEDNKKIIINNDRGLLKIVVLNRYKKSKPVIGFINGFKFSNGALATSVAHDSHNIVAVGTNDKDLVDAINLLNKSKGGVVVCSEKLKINEVMPLRIGGIVSDRNAEDVKNNYLSINENIKKLGSKLSDPLMTLSFMSLSVIPALKITAKGLMDSNKFEIVSLVE